MIEELGKIIAVDGDIVTIETEIKTTCNGCAANSQCGTGVVARAFSPRKDTLSLACSEPAEVGQMVKLGIPEQTLLGASALVYMLPLAVLVGSSLLLSGVFSHELMVVAGSFLATLLTFEGIRRYLKRSSNDGFQPTILAVLPAPAESIPVREVH